jgi:hypothetical protein
MIREINHILLIEMQVDNGGPFRKLVRRHHAVVTERPSPPNPLRRTSAGHMRSIWLSFWAGTLAVSPSFAQENVQQAIDKAIDSAKQICLVGSRYKFNLDVAGKLTVTKILPGGEVKATVDAANSTGGVLFENEEIRQLVDREIRKCIGRAMASRIKRFTRKGIVIDPDGRHEAGRRKFAFT